MDPSNSEPIQLSAAVVAIWPNESRIGSMSRPNVSMTRMCPANSTAVSSSTTSATVIEPNPSVTHSR